MSNIKSLDEALYKSIVTDTTSPYERKEFNIKALKEDLMGALDKQVKSLDNDAWMYAAPRTQLHLLSRAGAPSSRWVKSSKQEIIQTKMFQSGC